MIRIFKTAFRPARSWRLGCAAALLLAYPACNSDDKNGTAPSSGEGGEDAAGNASSGGSKSDQPDAEGGTPTAEGGNGSAIGGAGAAGEPALPEPSLFALGSVVINAEGDRTTYLQTVKSLDDGPFDNDKAIEMPGNGTFIASGDSVFAGLAEEPTWVRYTPDADGTLKETGRLSFLSYGIPGMDYGNAVVNDELAVSVLSGPAVAVVWSTKTMEIVREVDISHLVVPGYSLEVWTTVAYNGLVYIPGRWADWDAGKIRPTVSLTIIDPIKGEVVGVAEDDRCASGGQVTFDKDGYAYVMGDGRTYSIQMYANAANKPAPQNCLLRIAPGKTDFEKDYFYTIPSLTGGPEAIGEMQAAAEDSGIGLVKMFDASKLPADVKPVDFGFWDYPAHKMWRIELADPPVAKPVDGAPYSAIGFTPSAFRGKLYSGESIDQGATSDVYVIDPETNEAKPSFKMTGYFDGLFELNLK